MSVWLYQAGPNAGLAFLIVTVLLGGLTAFATGQAIAETWRPAWQVPLYVLLLGMAARFVQFAVFGSVLMSLPGYLVDLAVFGACAAVGYVLTRRGQMARQYPWLTKGGLTSGA